MKIFIAFLFAILTCNLYAQTGIGSKQPSNSAILDLNAANLGLKGPEIELQNINDVTTIPNPTAGLIVYSTKNNGTPPNQVFANAYYYWNGTSWFHIPTTRVVQEISTTGVFVISSNDNQTISDINTGTHHVVTFPAAANIINVGDIASKLDNQTIKIQETGLYELSAFVNYNPSQATTERRAMLNTYVERRVNGTGAWLLVAGGRTAWGRETTNYMQTASIPITCVLLNEGDHIRFTIANKITSGTRSIHGAPSYIQTQSYSPISKSLRLYLIGYQN